MDIVITLPVELCTQILEGKKTVVIRKRMPKNFNCICDSVYVILKGTRKLVMWFSIKEFIRYDSPFMLWQDYCYKIGVSREWFLKYTQNCNCLYVWEIGFVYEFQSYIDAGEYFGIYHNPQSFIYV